MRYTTIIDIREFRRIDKNVNARLIYLELVLSAGYLDSNRDLVDISIRKLASRCNITVAATRHALSQLEQEGLVTRQGPLLSVKKYLLEAGTPPRPKNKAAERQSAIAREREEADASRESERELQLRTEAKLMAKGTSEFLQLYQNKQAAAAAGDTAAAQFVIRYKAQYEQQKETARRFTTDEGRKEFLARYQGNQDAASKGNATAATFIQRWKYLYEELMKASSKRKNPRKTTINQA